jgi:hypothetical protein
MRRVLFTLLTIAFALIVLWRVSADGRSLGFAFGINYLLMAWAIPAGLLVPLRFPAPYYAVRRFERTGHVYDWLGVRLYQRVFRRLVWSVNPARLRSEPGVRAMLMQSTYDPDTGHLIIFLVITAIIVRALFYGWWGSAWWLFVFNMLHNGFPVMSMRQIRARLASRADRRPTDVTQHANA